MTVEQQVTKAIVTYIVAPMTYTASAAYLGGGVTTTAYYDGGYDDIIIHRSPIISISEVFDTICSSTANASSYSFYPEQGLLYKVNGGAWEYGRRRWKVTYVAGYATMPQDIDLAIDMWVAQIGADSTGCLASYSTGDDSETYIQIGDMPPTVRSLISHYRKRSPF